MITNPRRSSDENQRPTQFIRNRTRRQLKRCQRDQPNRSRVQSRQQRQDDGWEHGGEFRDPGGQEGHAD